MRRAIIYVRVSTDEQSEKGYSLKHQEERIRQYCEYQKIEVVGFYREDHSAKTFDRPEFTQLLQFLKKNRGKADLLLFLKWDRFSRNAGDAYSMINQLNKLGVEPQAIEQPLDLNVPENKIMLAFYLAAPEVENDRRSLNTIAGMRRAMKEGRYVTVAPRGYKNVRNEQNKPVIIPDLKLAPLIRWVFEEVAKGTDTVKDIWRKARKKGLTVGRSNIWYMLRNPIYCGKIYLPPYKDEGALLVKGLHEPIVSEGLFYEVQDVLEGKKRKVPSKNTAREELPLRGFLQCRKCGKNLTGSSSKGNGGKYFYYHCTNECGERFQAIHANTIFLEELRRISANEENIQLFEMVMKEYSRLSGKERSTALKEVDTEIEKNRERILKAQQLMVDGQLDTGDYKEIKSRYEPEIQKLLKRKSDLSSVDEKIHQYAMEATKLLRRLPEYYESASLFTKQRIIGSIYSEKLIFEKTSYRTARINEVIELICRVGKSSKTGKKELASKKRSQSEWVTPSGFKPETF